MIAKTKGKTKLTPAAAYIRFSSDQQAGSDDDQETEIAKLADLDGCEIVRTFKEPKGVSGDSDDEDRPEFGRMLEAARRGEFEVLLAWDLSRIGRTDSIDSGLWLSVLRKAGIRIATCCDGEFDPTDRFDRLKLGWSAEANNEENVKRARNVIRGLISCAKEGHRCGGRANFGYERVLYDAAGKFVRYLGKGDNKGSGRERKAWFVRLRPSRNEAEVAAVRFAFKEFADRDISLRELCRRLEDRGHPSPTGRGWNVAGLRDMLKRPVYAGVTRWGTWQAGKYHTHRADEIVTFKMKSDDRRRKDADDCIVVEGTHDALVDQATWKRVQRRLERTGPGRRKPREAFPLSGLMHCSHCGQPMWGETTKARRRKDKRRPYTYRKYVCSSYLSRPGSECRHFAVPADPVHRFVIGLLQRAFLAGGNRGELVAAIERKLRDRAKTADPDRARAERELAATDREVARLRRAIRRIDDDGLVDQLAEAKGRRERLGAVLSSAARLRTPKDVRAEAERVAGLMWELGERLAQASPETLRATLQQVVQRIDCRWETRHTAGGGVRNVFLKGSVKLREIQGFPLLPGSVNNP